MGSVVGTAANGVGTLLGQIFSAPFRAVFSASCECSGTWDVICFLEHVCVANLARLFMVVVLIYIMLFFVYLMCKVGIIQCVVKNSSKMAAAACLSCCHALTGTSCFLWRKLHDTKRVYRGRRRRRPPDIEEGGGEGGSAGSSSDEQEDSSGSVGLEQTEVPSTSLRVHGSPERSVHRGHRRRQPPDIEAGGGERGSAGSSSDEDEEDSSDSDHDRTGRGASRWSRARGGSSSVRERRKDRLRRSLRLRRLASKKGQYAKVRSHGSGRHHQRGRVGLERTEVPSTLLRVHGSPERSVHRHPPDIEAGGGEWGSLLNTMRQEKKLATRWEDYEATDCPDGKASDAVIRKFWAHYRVDDDEKEKANKTLLGACHRLTRQQWYNQNHTAVNHFMAEQGKKARKHDNVKEMPELTKQDLMSVMPDWADDKEDAYEALVMRWLGLDPDFDAVSKRNKKNRGNEGTHSGGSRNHDRFKEKMEADTQEPVTDLRAWQKMKEKKPDLDEPQPSLPEYFGKAADDVRLYCSTFQGLHPEVDDPIREETDETALIMASHSREHGHYRILNAVIKPTTSLTCIRATHTADLPPIAPPRRRRQSTDPDFDAAYDFAHADYMAVYQAWLVSRDAYDEYQELVNDSVHRFMTTGERCSIPERPPSPGVPPVCPSREEFAHVYYSATPGTGCSGTQPFGRASALPGSSREITPLHPDRRSPGASLGASTSPVNRRRSPELGLGDLGL